VNETPTDTTTAYQQALSDAVNAHREALLAVNIGDNRAAHAMWLLREAHIRILANHQRRSPAQARASVFLEHRRMTAKNSTA
jgi:hypothetical protein